MDVLAGALILLLASVAAEASSRRGEAWTSDFNPYKILGVRHNSDISTMKQAYLHLIQRCGSASSSSIRKWEAVQAYAMVKEEYKEKFHRTQAEIQSTLLNEYFQAVRPEIFVAVCVTIVVFLAVQIKRHLKDKPVLDISASLLNLTEDASVVEEEPCPDLAAEQSLSMATSTPPSPFFSLEEDEPSCATGLDFKNESQPSIHDTVNLTVTNDFTDQSSQGLNIDAEAFPVEQPSPAESEENSQRDSAKNQDSGVEIPEVGGGDVDQEYSRISLLPEVQPSRAAKKMDIHKALQDPAVKIAALLQPTVPVNTFHGVFFNYHGGCDWFFLTERRKELRRMQLRKANSNDWKPRCKLPLAAAAEADLFLASTGFDKDMEPYRLTKSGKMLYKQLEDSGRWQEKVAKMEKKPCGCRKQV